MLRIDIHRWVAMVANLNSKWPPIYKNPRFGRNLVSKYIMMLRIYSHRWFAMAAFLNPKLPPQYKNPPILGEIWFPSRF
jgi:hypothetical protein